MTNEYDKIVLHFHLIKARGTEEVSLYLLKTSASERTFRPCFQIFLRTVSYRIFWQMWPFLFWRFCIFCSKKTSSQIFFFYGWLFFLFF